MFEKEIAGRVFEFNCKLGTTVKIKTKMGKPFMQVVQDLDKMDTPDLVKFLYCGIDETKVTKDDFNNHLFENCGFMDLLELVQSFVKKLQYPNLTEEEIDQKMQEKNKQAETLKSTK